MITYFHMKDLMRNTQITQLLSGFFIGSKLGPFGVITPILAVY